jgi:hypothetical protein
MCEAWRAADCCNLLERLARLEITSYLHRAGHLRGIDASPTATADMAWNTTGSWIYSDLPEIVQHP